MAMGKRKDARQEALFVTADGLAKSPGHPFYRKLNELLAEAGFDRWIENRCRQYYATAEKRGQPSIPPGVYFRMLLVGYFEGIDSQRGIAWRCADSLSLRAVPGHSARRIDPRSLDPDQHPQSFAAGGVRRSLPVRAHNRRGQKALVRQNGRRRQHDARGQRGHEEHRAPRHGRGLEGVRHPADERGRHDRGRPGTDRRRGSPLRQTPEKQASQQRGVDVAERSGEPHHADEGRPHAPGLQGRARGRLKERPGRGGRHPSGRSCGHRDDRRQRDAGPEQPASGRKSNTNRRGGRRQRVSRGAHAGTGGGLADCEPTSPSRGASIAGVGPTSRPSITTPSISTAGAWRGPRASAISGCGANCANGRSPTCATREACGGAG